MIPVIVRTIANLASVAINCIAITVTFPVRYRRSVVFGLFALLTALLAAVLFGTGGVNIPFGGVLGSYGGIYALIYLPLITWVCKGLFFQKLFVVASTLLASVTQSYLTMAIIEIYVPYGSDAYFLVLLPVISIVYAAYAAVMLKYGWGFMKRLFAAGSRREWALYATGAVLSYVALMLLHEAPIRKALYLFLLVFNLWSFAVLCFAIINTHEKAKQRYEIEFARNIISSGREHYQKMDEMHDKLRVLRHDYKYHLSAAREMLRSGDSARASQYLTDVDTMLSEYELHNYCQNSVINALVATYAERCRKQNIILTVDIAVLKAIPVPNYEMCIIIGNLLDNAMEACEKLKDGRRIEFTAQSTAAQLMLRVENSCDGTISHNEETLTSEKINGGLGLQSVKAVAVRYGGVLLTKWDGNTFTAYVTVKL